MRTPRWVLAGIAVSSRPSRARARRLGWVSRSRRKNRRRTTTRRTRTPRVACASAFVSWQQVLAGLEPWSGGSPRLLWTMRRTHCSATRNQTEQKVCRPALATLSSTLISNSLATSTVVRRQAESRVHDGQSRWDSRWEWVDLASAPNGSVLTYFPLVLVSYREYTVYTHAQAVASSAVC